MSDQTRLVIEGILDNDGFRQTNGTSFREWFNAHEAKVRADAKVEALREAVSDFEDNVGIGEFAEQSRRVTRGGWAHIDEAWESQGPYMDWLRNRADNLEAS